MYTSIFYGQRSRNVGRRGWRAASSRQRVRRRGVLHANCNCNAGTTQRMAVCVDLVDCILGDRVITAKQAALILTVEAVIARQRNIAVLRHALLQARAEPRVRLAVVVQARASHLSAEALGVVDAVVARREGARAGVELRVVVVLGAVGPRRLGGRDDGAGAKANEAFDCDWALTFSFAVALPRNLDELPLGGV